MKIQVVTQETKTEEVEITLPYFSKNDLNIYKVVSEELCIQVVWAVDGLWSFVGVCEPSMAFNKGNAPCTEKEFNDAYKRVLNRINKIAFKS